MVDFTAYKLFVRLTLVLKRKEVWAVIFSSLIKNKSLRLPILLVSMVLVAIWFGPVMSTYSKQFFYSISISLSGALIFIMPLLIFFLLFSSLFNMSGYVIWLLALLLPAICLSNFVTTMMAYFSGVAVISHLDMLSSSLPNLQDQLPLLWKINFPVIISNQKAMVLAIALAIIGILSKKQQENKLVKVLQFMAKISNKLATNILQKGIVPVLPLFVFGFLLKLEHDDLLSLLISKYGLLFAIILCIQLTYVMLLYFIAAKFNLRKWVFFLKNMLSAWMVGFTTMSSAAAMPLTLNASLKNTSSDIPKAAVPATVNIHLVGDCIAIPILALALLVSFDLGLPDLNNYLIFALYFVVAKFAVAAVPAGGIIVMLPILEQYLGFNSSMTLLITTLYILFDCVITSTNILGNGVFAILFSKILLRFKKKI